MIRPRHFLESYELAPWENPSDLTAWEDGTLHDWLAAGAPGDPDGDGGEQDGNPEP